MSWRHLGIFQGKCLRDMFRSLGDFFSRGRCLRDVFKSVGDILFVFFPARCLRYVKMSESHVKVSERQFGIFSGKMFACHVKMSGKHVKMIERHLGICSGKMSEGHVKMPGRHVKMYERHIGFFEGSIYRST